MRTPQEKRELTPRDRKILRHVSRFGLTTFSVLHRVFFRGREPDAVKSTLRRLCGDPERPRYLKSEKLCGQHVYYRLTPRGASTLGLQPWRPRPFGLQALYQRFAILSFIHDESRSGRRLVSFGELESEFGIKVDKMPRHVCYMESRNDQVRLGIIVLDYRAHPNRIVRKATAILAWFLNKGWFDDAIRDKAFALTVLTLSAGKRFVIERALPQSIQHQLKFPLSRLEASVGPGKHIELNVEVIEGLDNLLPPESEDLP